MDRFPTPAGAAGSASVLEARSWGQRRPSRVALAAAFVALVLLAIPADAAGDAPRR